MCKRVCNGLCREGVQEKGVQGCAGVCKGVQGCAGVCRGVQGGDAERGAWGSGLLRKVCVTSCGEERCAAVV